MSKTDRTVVRNESCRRGNLADRYRHNERRNECYGNGDVIPECSHLNVHFKRCEGTYTEAFDRLVAEGVISTRGLGKDPKIVDEMVFDVNTAYFDEHGGYEYAKKFFAEAYKLAVREAGGEEYILSAVLHADERNRAESERLGRDVYHYHLHVMYVPVVDKEVKWSKRCKDPALVGTVREVIKQVSHSKKWPRHKTEGGWINSYSLLQDRFYEHMREAGFTGFERGERGSTAEHLTVLDYKIRKDTARLSGLEQNIQQAEKRLDGLQKKMTVLHKSAHTYGEVEQMARRGKTGKMLLEPEDWRTVCDLAKEGISYKTVAFVFVKRNKKSPGYFVGCGYWTRANAEVCLLATRGNPKRVSKSVRQIIDTPIGRHSEKPAEARSRIVDLLGDLPRVELFARERVDGWDCWGNEGDSDITFMKDGENEYRNNNIR